jgi:hypothetical protein
MTRPRRLWFHACLVPGLAAVVVACANPLWRHDRYVLEGAFMGTTCRATIDGRHFAGDTAGLGEKLTVRRDLVQNADLPEGTGVKTLVCRGLVMEIVSKGEDPEN